MQALTTTLRPFSLFPSHLRSFPTRCKKIQIFHLRNAATAALLKKLPEEVVIEDEQVNAPAAKSFTDLQTQLSRPIFKALTERPFNYTTLSTVQNAVLSMLPDLTGTAAEQQRDLLVKAKTGSGKTLAFLIPALQRHFASKAENATDYRAGQHAPANVGVLVLSPTRELATQIAEEARKLMSHYRRTDVCLFVGGASKGEQIRDWRRSSRDIVVATPGRMLDLLQSAEHFPERFSECKTLILDEADTLLDMGFKDELEAITNFLPNSSKRQTFLFSATVSSSIQKIARATLKKDHAFIDCVAENEQNVHQHVPQYVSILQESKSLVPYLTKLLATDMLRNPHGGKAIVFLNTTRQTSLFTEILYNMRDYLPWGSRKMSIIEIHSGKSQMQRDRASKKFREATGGYQVLVTSDVSARGVDYPNVTNVIQVGPPKGQDVYIHRIGRTGRAGKPGRGDLVLLDWEADYVQRELRDVPLQPLLADQVDAELKTLAEKEDAHPTKPLTEPGRENRLRKYVRGRLDITPSLPMAPRIAHRASEIESGFQEACLPVLDREMIEEAFMASLGYYRSIVESLRVSPMEMVKNLQRTTKEVFGLEEEPYVNPGVLKQIGANERRRKPAFSSSRGGFSRDRSPPSRSRYGARDRDRSTFEDRSSLPHRFTNDRNDPRKRGGRSSFHDHRDDRRDRFGPSSRDGFSRSHRDH